MTLQGLTMDRPLLLNLLLWRGERVYGDKVVLSRHGDEVRSRTYAQVAQRARQLGAGLRDLGVCPGDRVASLAWNSHPHLEAYFAVPSTGAVLHTANFRLKPEQVVHTLVHGGAKVLLVDEDQCEFLDTIVSHLPQVEHVVVMNGQPSATGIGSARLHDYEELVAASAPAPFPDFDERAGAVLCYTSATTGDPKGVLYSHRALVLHALQHSLHGGFGVRESMRVLAVAPMFHANGWGIPFAATMQGATLILPGARPDGASLVDLVKRTGATHLNAAVTLGAMVRDHARRTGSAADLGSLEELWLGGQAPPPGLVQWFWENVGAEVHQGWGLTETAVVTYNRPREAQRQRLADTELFELGVRQGTPNPLVEIDLIGDDGRRLPWDGKAKGEYVVRGPSIAGGYFGDAERSATALTPDGWLHTGDIGVIDPDASLRVLDRQKDLIKSGGEWIATIELENRLSLHPQVAEAAVVGVPHETWVERPIAWVVPVDPSDPPTAEALRSWLDGAVERWWIPDRFEIVAELPRTGVGKTDKKTIRQLATDSQTSTENTHQQRRKPREHT